MLGAWASTQSDDDGKEEDKRGNSDGNVGVGGRGRDGEDGKEVAVIEAEVEVVVEVEPLLINVQFHHS